MLVLGDGVTSSFETRKWALNLGSLQGQYMILTVESSFQPYILNVEYYPLLPPKLFVSFLKQGLTVALTVLELPT